MRVVVLFVGGFGLTACFALDGSEYVRVRVPVGQSADCEVSVTQPANYTPAPPDPCVATAPDIATCTPVAFVRAHEILTGPDCYLDNKVTNGEVGRVMQCAGSSSGAAIAVFERATFVGKLTGGYLDVCKSTTYDIPEGDRCTWRTEQRLSGALSDGTLAFSYSEGPVAGRKCTLACQARAAVDVLNAATPAE